jgi:hypothetical protein
LLVTILALAVMMATGCRQRVIRSEETRNPSDALIFESGRGAMSELGLPLFDGFEGDSVASFWLPGNYGSGRYEAGAVSISRSYARTGRGSVRITIKEGDIEQINDDGVRLERAELDSGLHPFLRRDVWVGFSFLLPPDFPVVDNRLVIAQWKQEGFSPGPLVAQRYRNGEHYLTVRVSKSSPGETKRFTLPPVVLGRWNDMIYHVRFSPEADGCIEVWMNGVQVVSQAGRTSFEDGGDKFYHKIGLYRDRWQEPMTIYFDNYTLSDSFKAVDPSRFDPVLDGVEQSAAPNGTLCRR